MSLRCRAVFTPPSLDGVFSFVLPKHSSLPTEAPKYNLKLRCNPIFHLSNVFAIFPFKLSHQLELKYSYISLIFSLTLLVVFCGFSFFHLRQIIDTEKSNTNILLYSAYTFMNFVFGIVCVIAPILNRRSILSILKRLPKVDRVVSQLEPDFKFYENFKTQYQQVCFVLGVTLLFIFLYFKASQENIFPSFTFLEFYILPVTWLIVFQLDYILITLRKRFAFVSSQLRNLREKMVVDRNEGSAINTPTTVNVSLINRLNFVHFGLYEISFKVNHIYSNQLMIMVPRLIFFSVLPVHYNIVTALVKDPKNNSGPHMWTNFFTLSYIALLTWPIIHAVKVASRTVTEAKEINLLVHDLLDEEQNEQDEYELRLLSIQLLHRQVEFSVKHFFNLEPALTTVILELIITYVIILLQFQDTLTTVSPMRLLLRPHALNPSELPSTTNHHHFDESTEFRIDVFNNTLYSPT